ncbi:MAG: small multi-drug export protein, partial [Victivallales bacterium]|nr:small multi-drug export protein [Victivallales bacterium]
ANHLWKMVVTHIIGGAAFGVTTGATFPEIPVWENIVINTLLTITIIFLVNTLLNLSGRKLVKISILDRQIKNLNESAAGQKKKWSKLGIPGIFIFVMLPMTSTGPIVGSFLGRMIGLAYWTNLITVTCGSIATILTFGFAADKLAQKIGDKTLGMIILAMVGIMVVIFVAVRIISWLKQLKKSSES